jgi:hypothetical protein
MLDMRSLETRQRVCSEARFLLFCFRACVLVAFRYFAKEKGFARSYGIIW